MVIDFRDVIEAMEEITCDTCKHWKYNEDKFAYRGSCAKMRYQDGEEFKPIYTDGNFMCLGWEPNRTKPKDML